jgi:hypothetical protein
MFLVNAHDTYLTNVYLAEPFVDNLRHERLSHNVTFEGNSELTVLNDL